MSRPADALVRIRKVAEEAVADMPIGDLKLAAFETILRSLLEQDVTKEDVKPLPSTRRSAVPESKPSTKAAKNGTTTRILELASEGFFKEQRSLAEIQRALQARGWYYEQQNLGTPLTRLTRKRALRRVEAADGAKRIWKYSEY